MTIHAFDGFRWVSSKYNPKESDSLSSTNLPFDYSSTMDSTAFAMGGGYARLASLGSLQSVITRIRQSAPAGQSKLVVGARVKLGGANGGGNGSMFSIIPTVGSTLALNAVSNQWPNFGSGTKLPIFCIDRYSFNGIYLLNPSITTWSTSTYVNSGLITKPLAGVDFTQENMYEVVYLLDENRIELWVNDVRLVDFSYTFTAAQKSSYYFMHPLYVVTGAHSFVECSCIYFADTRLGPVKAIGKEPASDVEVSPSFGEGPYFSKVNASVTPTLANRLSTKVSATALFGYSGTLPEDAQVLSVNQTTRFSTTHKSARETQMKGKLIIDVNGNRIEQPEFTANPDVEYYKNYTYSMETNPATNAPWTANELNNMVAGFALTIEDRFTVVE